MPKIITGGPTQTGRLMKTANSSSTPKESSSVKRLTIQARLPNWVIAGEELPFSALTAEKSGDEWFLLIHLERSKPSTRLVKFPARDILINGKSLDHYLEAIATKSI